MMFWMAYGSASGGLVRQRVSLHAWVAIKGTGQIRVILYAKEPSFHTSTLRRGQGICAPRFGLCQGGGQSRMVRPSAPLSLQLPEPDPGVHRLLAGVGNLLGPQSVDPVANGIDLSLLEHVSPIEWDNVVLYGQYILAGS